VTPTLRVERSDNGVVVLRLNRPDRLNALTAELVDAASWMLTGRLVGADEALRSGLVSEVAPDGALVDRAIEVAGEIVANARS
jgi:enoyl-CoA hydratase/carnithine racemase